MRTLSEINGVAERPGPRSDEGMTLRSALVALLPALMACGGVSPLGNGFSGGTATDSCVSGQHWTAGNSESELMNPGLACRSCHLGQNFMGQNPTGQAEPRKAYFFMGTAFSAPHQEDLCAAEVPTDAVVEILDTNDVVQLTLKVNSAGNFRSMSTTAGVPVPYKARVRVGTKLNAMGGTQTDGDCNSCHTAAGAQSAPGRIFFPL